MADYILSIDQGTTSSRAILFDREGGCATSAQMEFTQHYPHSAWVEHDANEIWASVQTVAKQALEQAQITTDAIHAVGITNQRETTVLWDRTSGEPLGNAIVWQDRRTSSSIDSLTTHSDDIQARTGLVLDAYFSASKLQWLLENIPNARSRAEAGDLCFGTIDSWLIFKMTKGRVHATDSTNACRTLLYNLNERDWDTEMLKLFNIPESVLPTIIPSSGIVGEWNLNGHTLPIAGIAGDQQAATFGHGVLETGTAKNTYGTGCFLVIPTGAELIRSEYRLLSTVAWDIPDSFTYALEGSLFTTGAAIQWLRDGLGIINEASQVSDLASQVQDTDGVVFVPALSGLGAPHWDQYARGTLVGITRGTTKHHIARATLEGIALQVCDIINASNSDLPSPTTKLRVDGGASKSDVLMQLQADLLQIPVERPDMTELTAKGAAYLAGIATGFWESAETLNSLPESTTTFTPSMNASVRETIITRWLDAVERSKGWGALAS